MARIICRPAAALLLAALLFALSACAEGDLSAETSGGDPPPFAKPAQESAPPSAGVPPFPSQDEPPEPSQSEPPSPSQSEPPSPSQGEPSSPSQSEPPSPFQSEPPSPSQGEPSSPSQSELPSPSQGEPPSPSQGELPSPSQGELPSPSQSEPPSPSQGALLLSSVPVAQGEDVGNDWFADAVFVGDSRTDGLRLYSGIKGASFICHAGLSVFTVDSNACIKTDDGTKITAMEALGKQQWAKVYLTLGINELGYSLKSFKKAYTGVVEQIRQLQPGAAIYLQTLIPVNEPIAYQNGTNRAINNEKLRQFNEVISQIAQEQNVNLVDVDAPFWTTEGCLSAENTGDGVHLTRAGYTAWYAYLRTHTGGNTQPIDFWPLPQDPLATAAPPQDSAALWGPASPTQ